MSTFWGMRGCMLGGMRVQVEVWRENEDRLRLLSRQAGHPNLRETASLILNRKLQEDAHTLSDQPAAEEVA
jgi:hypothetical protein